MASLTKARWQPCWQEEEAGTGMRKPTISVCPPAQDPGVCPPGDGWGVWNLESKGAERRGACLLREVTGFCQLSVTPKQQVPSVRGALTGGLGLLQRPGQVPPGGLQSTVCTATQLAWLPLLSFPCPQITFWDFTENSLLR